MEAVEYSQYCKYAILREMLSMQLSTVNVKEGHELASTRHSITKKQLLPRNLKINLREELSIYSYHSTLYSFTHVV